MASDSTNPPSGTSEGAGPSDADLPLSAAPVSGAGQPADALPEAHADIQIEGYQLQQPIGVGGMGAVWSAVQLSTRRRVAIKLLYGNIFASRQARRRFETEVELASRLEHSNIARVYDSGIHEGVYFYAMEQVDGVHLDRHVFLSGWSQRQILALMAKVCRTVDYAHRRGVIHRDLKPANILVSADGEPHIVDFGLAKAVQEAGGDFALTSPGEVVGTLQYMPPEQAAGHFDAVDSRGDVYSLGVVLHQLLVGQLPHDSSGSRYEVQRRIIEEEPRRPRALCPTMDADLEAMLLKALARDPDHRYATPGDLADDIANYLQGNPLTARPLTAVYFLRKRLVKYRRRVALVALVLAVLLVSAGLSYVQVMQERDAARLSAHAANQALYANRIVRARMEIERGHVAAAQIELALCPEALRGWEWHRLSYLADQSVTSFAVHDEWIDQLALDPAQNQLILVDFGGLLKVSDPTGGEPLHTTRLYDDPSIQPRVALAEGGAMAAVARETVIDLVSPQTGDTTWRVHTGEPVEALALSADAHWLAAATADAVLTWEVGHAQPTLDASTGEVVRNLAIGDDGTLVAASHQQVICFDGSAGALRWEHVLNEPVTTLAATFRGGQVAAGTRSGVSLYDLHSGAFTRQLPTVHSAARVIRFSPEGGDLFVAEGTLLHRWATATGAPRGTFRGHTGTIRSIAIDLRGRVLSAGYDGTIKTWRRDRSLAGRGETQVAPPGNPLVDLDLAPTGVIVASDWQGQIHTRGGPQREWVTLAGQSEGPISRVAVRSAGDRVAGISSDGVWVGRLPTGTLVRTAEVASDRPAALAWCPRTGHLAVATAGSDSAVMVIDTDRHQVIRELDGGHHIAFSPEGDTLVTVDVDTNDLLLWDTRQWALRGRIATGAAEILELRAAHAQAAIATLGSDRTIRIWNLASGELQTRLQLDSRNAAHVRFTPDDARLLVTVERTVQLWDPETRNLLVELTHPEQRSLTSVAFCAASDRVIAGVGGSVVEWFVHD